MNGVRGENPKPYNKQADAQTNIRPIRRRMAFEGRGYSDLRAFWTDPPRRVFPSGQAPSPAQGWAQIRPS